MDALGNRMGRAILRLHLLGRWNMYPEAYSLAKAGLSDAQTQAVMVCDTPDQKVRLLRKYRCAQLEELHARQQALDTLDYIICNVQGKRQTVKE